MQKNCGFVCRLPTNKQMLRLRQKPGKGARPHKKKRPHACRYRNYWEKDCFCLLLRLSNFSARSSSSLYFWSSRYSWGGGGERGWSSEKTGFTTRTWISFWLIFSETSIFVIQSKRTETPPHTQSRALTTQIWLCSVSETSNVRMMTHRPPPSWIVLTYHCIH